VNLNTRRTVAGMRGLQLNFGGSGRITKNQPFSASRSTSIHCGGRSEATAKRCGLFFKQQPKTLHKSQPPTLRKSGCCLKNYDHKSPVKLLEQLAESIIANLNSGRSINRYSGSWLKNRNKSPPGRVLLITLI